MFFSPLKVNRESIILTSTKLKVNEESIVATLLSLGYLPILYGNYKLCICQLFFPPGWTDNSPARTKHWYLTFLQMFLICFWSLISILQINSLCKNNSVVWCVNSTVMIRSGSRLVRPTSNVLTTLAKAGLFLQLSSSKDMLRSYSEM